MSEPMSPEQEMLSRIRRIETRVTRIGNHFNVDVGGAKPKWDDELGYIRVDSANCSIADLLNVVPYYVEDTQQIPVFIGDKLYMSIRLDPQPKL